MPSPSDMHGKVALITGGGGGLGSATARKLALCGAALCLVDRDEAGLTKIRAELVENGADVLCIAADIASAERCKAVVDEAIAHFGRLDALCNVAAIFVPCHFAEMSTEQWERSMSVNLSAPAHLTQAALPQLIEHQGAVVNVTSCAAHIGQAYTVAYAATKAGLTHLTKSLAMEYMHTGVRFNAVAPGGMMTMLAAGMRDLQDPDPSLVSRYHPLRGLVEIDDVADMVAFLATDAASGYHGAVINIDKGITAG